MIAGTIVMEDMQLHFILTTETESSVSYMKVSVCDSMTGVAETYLCSPDDFAVALGLAMHPNCELPMCPGDTLIGMEFQNMAEKAMPKNASLRWIS